MQPTVANPVASVSSNNFVPVVFPATKFEFDKDENGQFKINPKTKDYESGTFTVEILQKTDNNGGVKQLARHQESMSYTKFKAIREDIDALDVDGLKLYFPEIGKQFVVEAPKETPKDK